ncbi:hypothetical protein E2542_SST06086 [Spatholobus suberectus]|nr:hypothetical protein E2542_SST06086 [Spatholobus suberectus]
MIPQSWGSQTAGSRDPVVDAGVGRDLVERSGEDHFAVRLHLLLNYTVNKEERRIPFLGNNHGPVHGASFILLQLASGN